MIAKKITFKIDKELDKMICGRFLGFKLDGVNFGEGITYFHPKLKKVENIASQRERKNTISKYVDEFYNENKKEIETALQVMQNNWKKVEKDFFKEVKNIFGKHDWPKGEYIAYLSIFNCNPTFLKDKNFQLFYLLPKEFNRMIAHEMLHFIFYSYFEDNIRDKSKKKKSWLISEVFNAVVLNTKEFRNIVKPGKELGYPEHKEIISKMKKEWKLDKRIFNWIEKFDK